MKLKICRQALASSMAQHNRSFHCLHFSNVISARKLFAFNTIPELPFVGDRSILLKR